MWIQLYYVLGIEKIKKKPGNIYGHIMQTMTQTYSPWSYSFRVLTEKKISDMSGLVYLFMHFNECLTWTLKKKVTVANDKK